MAMTGNSPESKGRGICTHTERNLGEITNYQDRDNWALAHIQKVIEGEITNIQDRGTCTHTRTESNQGETTNNRVGAHTNKQKIIK